MSVPRYPQFEWSYSRWNMFEFCQRKFWHRYCGHWQGWLNDAPARTRRTYLLTKLKPTPAWIGGMAHSAIARVMAGQDPRAVQSEVRGRMAQEFQASSTRCFENFEDAKLGGLAEHFYDRARDERLLLDAQQKVEDAVAALTGSDFPAMFADARRAGRLAQIESADKGGSDFARMRWKDDRIGPFWIYSQPDCVIEHESGRFLILDWKTGNSRDTQEREPSLQLTLYVPWALAQNPDVLSRERLETIEAYEVHLPDLSMTGRSFSQDEIDQAYGDVRAKANRMLEKRVDGYGPLDYVTEEADFEARASSNRCGACEFRAVCEAKQV